MPYVWSCVVTGDAFERPAGWRGWLRPWSRYQTRTFVVVVTEVETVDDYDFVGLLTITDMRGGAEVSRRMVYFNDPEGWRALALHDLDPVMLGDTVGSGWHHGQPRCST